MATKKAPTDDTFGLDPADAELDQAIDDLRGVLKKDATGGSLDTDFGADFGASGSSDFGIDTSDIASGTDTFGGDFAGGGFGGDSFGATSFGDVEEAASGSGAFGAGSFDAPSSGSEPGSGLNANLGLIMEIPIEIQIVLGSSRMQVSSLMNLTEGATIALDRKIGDPVDIVVNGRLIGRGEITVLEEDETRFGVKLIEIKGTGKA